MNIKCRCMGQQSKYLLDPAEGPLKLCDLTDEFQGAVDKDDNSIPFWVLAKKSF